MSKSNNSEEVIFQTLRSRIVNPAAKAAFDVLTDTKRMPAALKMRPTITNAKKPKYAVEFDQGLKNPYSFIVNVKKGLLFYIKNPEVDMSDKLKHFLETEKRFEFNPKPNKSNEVTVRINSAQDANDLMAALFHSELNKAA